MGIMKQGQTGDKHSKSALRKNKKREYDKRLWLIKKVAFFKFPKNTYDWVFFGVALIRIFVNEDNKLFVLLCSL